MGLENNNEWPSPWKDWALDALKKALEEAGIKVETIPPPEGSLDLKPSVCVPLPESKPEDPKVLIDCGTITLPGGLRLPLKWAPNQIGPIKIEIPTEWDGNLRQNIKDFETHLNDLLNQVRQRRRDVAKIIEARHALQESIQRLLAWLKDNGYVENWEAGLRFDFNSVLQNLGIWPESPARQGCAPQDPRDLIDDAAFDDLDPFRRPDPLVLDLDNDGIETIGMNERVYFDHNGDGFAELTGWAAPDDGMLVMDRNGNGVIDNGTELFGDQTLLADGTKAKSGFQALAELDANGDGKIDAEDPGFSQLRVLKYSDDDSGLLEWRLYTLDELGIKSIDLDSTAVSIVDPAGNTLRRIGSFERTDGTTGQMGEYGLQNDMMYTIPVEWHEVSDDIAALPDLPGYGVVYDLHQAMVRDASGLLQSLVEQFIAAADDTYEREHLFEQILFKWAGGARMPQGESRPAQRSVSTGGGTGSAGGSRSGAAVSVFHGPLLQDNQKLAVLEHFMGEPWPGSTLNYASSTLLKEAYRLIFEMMYANLMAQTHLKELYDKLEYTWDEEKQEIRTDFTGVIPEIVVALDDNPEQGRQLLLEFARSLRGISSCSPSCYLTFREHMLEIDPELGWVFDTGGLPVYDDTRLGIRTHSPHIEGTDGAEAILGSLTRGDGWLNALHGDGDVIYGTDRDERLVHGTGDAVLVGGGGNDTIWAGPENDILDGGSGNDIMYGESGNDTYIFRRGSGYDIIEDRDATPGNMDTIWLGSNLTPDDIVLRRQGDNLVLRIIDTTDVLTVRKFFKDDGTLYRVERIQFMDGTVWDETDMIRATYTATEGD
ncbi:MAG: calcium-binding protein, partial [Desulfomonilaceae bacterium]|nr:calcium-binding protein [Desulfomonilaceae bacterium]